MHTFWEENLKIPDPLEGHVEDIGVCGRLTIKASASNKCEGTGFK